MTEIQTGDLIKVWFHDIFSSWNGMERSTGPNEWHGTLGIVLSIKEAYEDVNRRKTFKVFHPYSPARAHVVCWPEDSVKKVC